MRHSVARYVFIQRIIVEILNTAKSYVTFRSSKFRHSENFILLNVTLGHNYRIENTVRTLWNGYVAAR